MKKIGLLLCMILLGALGISALFSCKDTEKTEIGAYVQKNRLILATTTSTENSGLLEAILPDFEKKTGIKVDVVAVGTGAALQLGRDGEADVLLVHAKAAEELFVKEGHGLKRSDVMYNDFVIVGPKSDPAGLRGFNGDVSIAYNALFTSQTTFVSRGDDSGTHKKEKSIWTSLDLEPSGAWYVETGRGMGDTLSMADEFLGYTMTDRATFLAMEKHLDLEILVEGDPLLFNQYGIISVNPDKNAMINSAGAALFEAWLLEDAQALIETFGIEKYGEALFIPNAN